MDSQNPNVEQPPVSYSSARLHIENIADEVRAEVLRATNMWRPQNNAYEGFGVLLEEVDEFKAHVWMNQKKRDLDDMRKETIQIAAMAVRFMHDIGGYGVNHAVETVARVATHDAEVKHAMHSAHEGYIRLLERVEQMKRSLFLGAIRHVESDAIQVAAVAMRITRDVCDSGKGRV